VAAGADFGAASIPTAGGDWSNGDIHVAFIALFVVSSLIDLPFAGIARSTSRRASASIR
jgi:hypothetical protein